MLDEDCTMKLRSFYKSPTASSSRADPRRSTTGRSRRQNLKSPKQTTSAAPPEPEPRNCLNAMPPSILAHIMSLVSPYSERARLQLVNPNFKSVVNVWMSWTDITSVEIKCKCESNKGLSCVFNGGSATRKETISSGMQPTLADKEKFALRVSWLLCRASNINQLKLHDCYQCGNVTKLFERIIRELTMSFRTNKFQHLADVRLSMTLSADVKPLQCMLIKALKNCPKVCLNLHCNQQSPDIVRDLMSAVALCRGLYKLHAHDIRLESCGGLLERAVRDKPLKTLFICPGDINEHFPTPTQATHVINTCNMIAPASLKFLVLNAVVARGGIELCELLNRIHCSTVLSQLQRLEVAMPYQQPVVHSSEDIKKLMCLVADKLPRLHQFVLLNNPLVVKVELMDLLSLARRWLLELNARDRPRIQLNMNHFVGQYPTQALAHLQENLPAVKVDIEYQEHPTYILQLATGGGVLLLRLTALQPDPVNDMQVGE